MDEQHALFQKQFTTDLVVERGELLQQKNHTLVCGMGGSHLSAWLLKNYGGKTELGIHRDYGLPTYMNNSDLYVPQETLVILSSYSGTTEEILDAGSVALERGCTLAAITTGGTLADFAREHNIPLVIIPEVGLEPRLALGFGMRALSRVLQDESLETSIIDAGMMEGLFPDPNQVDVIATHFRNHIPLVWASQTNAILAYIWKVNLNETSKTPAFIDMCPELCHNELCGFDVYNGTRAISEQIATLLLTDTQDHPRVQKRMYIANDMLSERQLPVYIHALAGTGFEKVFRSALLTDSVARALAVGYEVPFPQTPLIAEFKHRMAQ